MCERKHHRICQENELWLYIQGLEEITMGQDALGLRLSESTMEGKWTFLYSFPIPSGFGLALFSLESVFGEPESFCSNKHLGPLSSKQ